MGSLDERQMSSKRLGLAPRHRLAHIKLVMLTRAVQLRRTARWLCWRAVRRVQRAPALRSAVVTWGRGGAEDAASLAAYERRFSATGAEPSYVIDYHGPMVIECKFGFGIVLPAFLLDLTQQYGAKMNSWQGRVWGYVPSFRRYALHVLARRRYRRLDAVYSAHTFWSPNFYHFIVEVMPKLLTRVRVGDIGSLPVLVSRELYTTRFFQDFLRNPIGAKLDVVVFDDGEYLRVNRFAFSCIRFEDLIREDLLEISKMLFPDRTRDRADRRIFVTRAPHRGRRVTNEPELLRVLDAHGFAVVDMDGLSLREQAALMHETELCVAIHGAGLTNMIFADPGRLTIVELHPPTEPIECFRDMARLLGHRFRRITGTTGQSYFDKRQDFEIDVDALDALLKELVGTAPAST
jgi:hypothetical protein